MKVSKKYAVMFTLNSLIIGIMGLAIVASLSRTSVGAQTTAPVLYDKNGKTLGQIVSGNGSSFYNASLDRLVTYSNGKVSTNVGAIYFGSTDCSGLALLPQNSVTNPTLVLIKLAPGKYYVDDPHASRNPTQLNSYLSSDGSCRTTSWTGLTPVDPVFAVTLPFSDPLVTPLSVAP